MYHKWDNVPKMGHNFLPSFTPFSTSFFRLFFAFLSSTWSWLCPRFIPKIDRWHRAFYPFVGGGTIIIMILVFIHLYDISSPSMAYFRVFPMCQNGIKSDGRRCQKGIESTRSMTTTAAKGANNPQKMSEFGADNATFMSQFPPPDHTFPEVLLGFLYIFSNKKPIS